MHPLDFLGHDDLGDLAFFPAMGDPASVKLERMGKYLDRLGQHFTLTTMIDHVTSLEARGLSANEPVPTDAGVRPRRIPDAVAKS